MLVVQESKISNKQTGRRVNYVCLRGMSLSLTKINLVTLKTSTLTFSLIRLRDAEMW